MKKQIKTVNKIDAPIEKVWEHLRTGKNVDSWLPVITSCRVEGNKRYCTTEDGKLNETILKSDNIEKVFQYSIKEQDVFPVTDIFGTMKLEYVTDDETNLLWDVEFDIEDENLFPQIKEGIEGIYKMGAEGLGKLANAIPA